MPSIEENKSLWTDYNWQDARNEWSRTWGGSEQLWSQSIFLGLHLFYLTGILWKSHLGTGGALKN